MSDTRELFDQVLKLPEELRTQLVAEVLASFKSSTPPAIERAWLDVAEQRLEEIRSGCVQTLSAEEADARTEARLAKIREGR